MTKHNQACARYCIDVIRAVLQEQPVPALPEAVSLEALYAFARMHNVEALVYAGVSALNIDADDSVMQAWENRAQMILTQSIVQLADRDALFAAMQEAGVEILPIKGCWIKECYAQIDFRQMADLDILIHEEDRVRAGRLMREWGYEEEFHENPVHHDSYEKKPYTAVELHFQMLPRDNEHAAYYANIWDKAQAAEGYSLVRRLPAEDEYIYYILHLKKHMETAGCGIRMLLDCVVYRSMYPDWDREYLMREFTRLGIWEYVLAVEQLADCWFVSGAQLPEAIGEMGNLVMWTDTYGSMDLFFQRKVESLKKKHKNPLVAQLMYWSSRFFLPLDEMKAGYPILKKAPILLPVCWVIRIVIKCIRRPRELMYHIKKVFGEGMKHD